MTLPATTKRTIRHEDADDPEIVTMAALQMFQEVLNPLALDFIVEVTESVKSPLAVEISLTLTRVPPEG